MLQDEEEEEDEDEEELGGKETITLLSNIDWII